MDPGYRATVFQIQIMEMDKNCIYISILMLTGNNSS